MERYNLRAVFNIPCLKNSPAYVTKTGDLDLNALPVLLNEGETMFYPEEARNLRTGKTQPFDPTTVTAEIHSGHYAEPVFTDGPLYRSSWEYLDCSHCGRIPIGWILALLTHGMGHAKTWDGHPPVRVRPQWGGAHKESQKYVGDNHRVYIRASQANPPRFHEFAPLTPITSKERF